MLEKMTTQQELGRLLALSIYIEALVSDLSWPCRRKFLEKAMAEVAKYTENDMEE